MSIFLENFLCALGEILGYVLCYLFILKMHVRKKEWMILYLILIIGMQLASQYWFGDMVDGIIPLFAGILFPFLGKREERKEMLISFVYMALIESIIDGIPSYFTSIMMGFDVTAKNGNGIIVLCRITFPLCVIGYYCITHFSSWKGFHIQFYKEHKITLFIALVCCNVIIGINLLMLTSENIIRRNVLVSGIATLFISILYLISVVWLGQVVWKNIEMQKEQVVYEYLTKTQKQYLDYIMKRDNELRKFRHDIHAHMIIMHNLAEKGDNVALLAYIEEVEEHVRSNRAQCFTGNSTVDAIINDLKVRMDQNAIDFKINGKLIIEKDAKVFDICICIYNILLNAIEACEKLIPPERKIRFDIVQYQKHIYMKICNCCEEKADIGQVKEMITDKEDKENHGWGSRNVMEIVQKYNGKVIYSVKDRWFVTEVLI